MCGTNASLTVKRSAAFFFAIAMLASSSALATTIIGSPGSGPRETLQVQQCNGPGIVTCTITGTIPNDGRIVAEGTPSLFIEQVSTVSFPASTGTGHSFVSIDLATGEVKVLVESTGLGAAFGHVDFVVPVTVVAPIAGSVTFKAFVAGTYDVQGPGSLNGSLIYSADLSTGPSGAAFTDNDHLGGSVSGTFGPQSGSVNSSLSSTVDVPAGTTDVWLFFDMQFTAARNTTGDFSHTATFGIDLPEGFAYSSALTFVNDANGEQPESVPEPSSLMLVASGLIGLALAARRRPRPA